MSTTLVLPVLLIVVDSYPDLLFQQVIVVAQRGS